MPNKAARNMMNVIASAEGIVQADEIFHVDDFRWDDHEKLPRKTAMFTKGLYSMLFSHGEGWRNRVVSMTGECVEMGEQTHSDMQEDITIMKGSVVETQSGRLLNKGNHIRIPAGVSHGWKRVGAEEVVMDLMLTHRPNAASA